MNTVLKEVEVATFEISEKLDQGHNLAKEDLTTLLILYLLKEEFSIET